MLENYERHMVEAIRRAKTIRIVIDEGMDTEKTFRPIFGADIKRITHDIAIAVQDYLNRKHYEYTSKTQISHVAVVGKSCVADPERPDRFVKGKVSAVGGYRREHSGYRRR